MVSRHAKLGPGTTGHGVIVNAGAVVGDHRIINSCALIEHDVQIGHYYQYRRSDEWRCVSWFWGFVGSGCIIRDGLTLPPPHLSVLVNASWDGYEQPMRTTPQTMVIAEAGVNHNGELHLASLSTLLLMLVPMWWFQTFQASQLATQYAQQAVYQKKSLDKSESQLQMLKRFELHPKIFLY